MKKRPRGKPFARGADPRRAHSAVALGATCPQCTAVGRTASSLPAAGTLERRVNRTSGLPFAGCSQYPLCGYTQDWQRTPGGGLSAAPAGVPSPEPAPATLERYCIEATCTERVRMTVEQAAAARMRAPWRFCARHKVLADDYVPPTTETPTQEVTPVPAPNTAPSLGPLPGSTLPPQPGTQAIAAAGSLDAMVAAIARQAAEGTVNEARVREIVGAEVEALRSTLPVPRADHFIVQVAEVPPVQVQGSAHYALRDVLSRLLARGPHGERLNVALIGPSGSGKSVLGAQVAEVLGMPSALWEISCAPDLPTSRLLGTFTPNLTTGENVYTPTPVVAFWRDGGVIVVDEYDNSDPSWGLVLNNALSSGWLTLPTGERVKRHDRCFVLVCMNTWGHGQSRQYVGRAQLDGAALQRFVGGMVEIDYDQDLERAQVPEEEIRGPFWRARERMRELGLQRILSTRGLVAMRILVQACAFTPAAALREICADWTPADRRSCGVAE
jgi:MoxR-like ATPase